MKTFALIALILITGGFAFAAFILATTRWKIEIPQKEDEPNGCHCTHPCNEYCYNTKMKDEILPGQIIKNQ